MDTKARILEYIKKKKAVSGRELVELLGISRQAVNIHIKELVNNDKVVKEGTTRASIYKISSSKNTRTAQRFRKIYILKGLEEYRVFEEMTYFLNLRKNLKKNVFNIVNYAFTEILNNAIEHSQSKKCDVEVTLDQYTCNFEIRDRGIGIFYSIFKKFELPDESSGVGELIKGKTTTMRERHTGEGVFFVSKAGDVVSFKSHKTNLIFDNLKKDVYAENKRFIKGTNVHFSISRYSKNELSKIFDEYASEEFEYKFGKTRVLVKLFQTEYISRSEALRLLSGLDKFTEIVLDFKGVKSLGQGFADEVFRVFKKIHPNITIRIENLSSVLKPIIEHVVDPVRD